MVRGLRIAGLASWWHAVVATRATGARRRAPARRRPIGVSHCVPVCLAVLAATHAATAQPSSALAERSDLPRLIDLASRQLGVAVEYDPGIFAGPVAIRLPDSVPDAELWALVNRLLAARGLTTVQMPGSSVFSVVKITDAAALARVESEGAAPLDPGAVGPAAAPPPPGFQSVVVRPRHRATKETADAIKPLLSKQGGSVTEVPSAGILIVSDLLPRLDQARRFLDAIDAPGAAAAVTEVPVSRAAPDAVIALAREVAKGREAATGQKAGGELIAGPAGDVVLVVGTEDQVRYWRSLIVTLDRPEAPEIRFYPVPSGSASEAAAGIDAALRPAQESEAWHVAADETAGVVSVRAVPSRHRMVEKALAEWAETQRGERIMRAIPVRNRPVDELLSTLNDLIDAGALDPDRGRAANRREVARRGVQGTVDPDSPPPREVLDPAARGAIALDAAGADPPIRLTADESTNTLIAIGEPRLIRQLESLIPRLDVRQPQVMLEVMLVSLSESDSIALGVELERIGELGSATYRLASLFGLSTGGPAGRTVGDSTGFTGTIIDPGEYAVIVRALRSVTDGRSISLPQVLVTNNEQATFSSVVQQPILETVRSETGESTSFGGTQDAGTTISVKPQIAQGDHLLLTYQVSLSSFVGSAATAGLPPPRQQSKVDSIATVPDGHTVVVGGLELTTNSKDSARVPLASRIPVLGQLFRNRARSASRSRFYVFLRATVLRNPGFEDLKFVSEVAADDADISSGLPTLAPRVIR